MLTRRDIEFYRDIRGGAEGDVAAAPLQDTDFSGLPPTVIVTAQCDPLSSDGEAYRDSIVAAGGKARGSRSQDLSTAILRARHRSAGRAPASPASSRRLPRSAGASGRARGANLKFEPLLGEAPYQTSNSKIYQNQTVGSGSMIPTFAPTLCTKRMPMSDRTTTVF